MSKEVVELNNLEARMKSVWLRAQILHFSAGLISFMRWSIPIFLIGMFIDWKTFMPSAGRAVILTLILAVSLYRAWKNGWCHLSRFNPRAMALELEKYHGKLESLLISALQFRDLIETSETANPLHKRTCKLANEAAATLEPDKVVPYKPLQKPSAIALSLSAVITVMAVVNGPFIGTGALRIFFPWMSVPYPTDTEITLVKEDLYLKEGSKSSIKFNLSGVIPEEAEISIKTEKSSARDVELEVSESSSEYKINSASRDFMYRIKAGDDRTDWHTVTVIPAPKIESVTVNVVYPEYLNRQQESIEALTLTVPQDSKLNWSINLDRPIEAGFFVADGDEEIKLTVIDGKRISFSQDAKASKGYNFKWIEKNHGFIYESPRYYLQVASDQNPRVELTFPESNLVAMLGRPLKLKARMSDDYGIASTKLAYKLNNRDEASIDVELSDKAGEQEIDWDYRQP